MDGNNYLDWELQIKTLLQYHRLWNVVNSSEKKPPVTSSPLTTSVFGLSKAEIEGWLDKDSRGHDFLMFNIKPSIARQFQDKGEETANEPWTAPGFEISEWKKHALYVTQSPVWLRASSQN